jgi:hypothetical protein
MIKDLNGENQGGGFVRVVALSAHDKLLAGGVFNEVWEEA